MMTASITGGCLRDHRVGGGGQPRRHRHPLGPLVPQETGPRQLQRVRYESLFVCFTYLYKKESK